MAFKVQFYSRFQEKWRDYAPITHNTRVPVFMHEQQAKDYKAKLEVQHPHDRFQVVGDL